MASALSEAAPAELMALYRSVMPVGAVITVAAPLPKQATNVVLAIVVVIDGVEAPTRPPAALMGWTGSTLEYELIPPAMSDNWSAAKR
jgi:hypothetical protein